MVWFGDGDNKIYLWDGATTTQITDNNFDDYDPAISGLNVVWHGGFLSHEIFMTTIGGTDTDGDGIPGDEDNCISEANSNQLDSDTNGFGNACVCDFNNDGGCGQPDYSVFLACFVLLGVQVFRPWAIIL